MAQTYAFALGGALLMALTLTPVLCMLFFKNIKPAREFPGTLLKYRTCLSWGSVCYPRGHGRPSWWIILLTVVWPSSLHLGREFMPELEEGNLWIRGTAPLNHHAGRQTRTPDGAAS